MRTLAIGTLLGAGLLLCACDSKPKEKSDGSGGASVKEKRKAETYVLATKGTKLPLKGHAITRELSSEMQDAKMSIETGGQKVEGTMSRSDRSVESWTYVADNKARRILESKSSTGMTNMNGLKQPTPEEKDPLVGVPVIVELKGGKYIATLESGTATGEQAKALEKLGRALSQETDFAMYGAKPRKVGERWDADNKALSGFGEANEMAGSYSLKFVEIKDFQGVPCAVLKSSIDICGVGGDGSGNGVNMTITIRGEGLAHRSLGDKTDLESTLNSTMTMDSSPGPGTTLHVEGPFNLIEKTRIQRP